MNFLSSVVIFATLALASLVNGQSAKGNGILTFYDTVGNGACGGKINAATEMLVAAPHSLFKDPNPNADPLCKKCISVSLNGKNIKVPIKDKCPSCEPNHIDLSKPAFEKLAKLDVGKVTNANWEVVNC